MKIKKFLSISIILLSLFFVTNSHQVFATIYGECPTPTFDMAWCKWGCIVKENNYDTYRSWQCSNISGGQCGTSGTVSCRFDKPAKCAVSTDSYYGYSGDCSGNCSNGQPKSSYPTCISPATLVNGSCGSSHDNNPCSSGTQIDLTDNHPNSWDWKCEGSGGGTTAICKEGIPINGQCNSIAGGGCSAGSTVGSLSSAAGIADYWYCYSSSGGSTSTMCSYSYPTIVNGGWSTETCPTYAGYPGGTITHTCTNPAPSGGGANCPASGQTESCSAVASNSVDADLCGSTTNSCLLEASSSSPNNSPLGYYTWTCSKSSYVTKYCSLTVSKNGSCGTSYQACNAGSLGSSGTNSSESYWSCLGEGTGTTASCNIPTTSTGTWSTISSSNCPTVAGSATSTIKSICSNSATLNNCPASSKPTDISCSAVGTNCTEVHDTNYNIGPCLETCANGTTGSFYPQCPSIHVYSMIATPNKGFEPLSTTLSWTTTGNPTSCDLYGSLSSGIGIFTGPRSYATILGKDVHNGDPITKISNLLAGNNNFGITCHKEYMEDAYGAVSVYVSPTFCGTANGKPQLIKPTQSTSDKACAMGGILNSNTPQDITTSGLQAWRWSCAPGASCSAPKFGCRITTDSNYSLPQYGANGPDNNWGCADTINVPSGTLSATSCTIAQDANTCVSKVTWTTLHLIAGKDTAVTRNNPDVTVSTAISGTTVSNTINYGNSTFYLYHNGAELKNAPVTATCATGTAWDAAIGKCKATPATSPNPSPTPTPTPLNTNTWGSWSGNTGVCGATGNETRTCNNGLSCLRENGTIGTTETKAFNNLIAQCSSFNGNPTLTSGINSKAIGVDGIRVPYNSLVTINWSTSNAQSCACEYSDSNTSGVLCPSYKGTSPYKTPALKRDTTYTLSCPGVSYGEAIKVLKVFVDPINTIYKEQ